MGKKTKRDNRGNSQDSAEKAPQNEAPHVNQRVRERSYPNRDIEEIKADVETSPLYKLGRYVEDDLPYLGKLISVNVVMGSDGPRIIEVFEPVLPKEAMAYLWPDVVHKSEKAELIYEVRHTVCLLRQEAWYYGVPKEEIYCDGCYRIRSAYGAHYYDHYLLCNECVEDYEINYALDKVKSIQDWMSYPKGGAFRLINGLFSKSKPKRH